MSGPSVTIRGLSQQLIWEPEMSVQTILSKKGGNVFTVTVAATAQQAARFMEERRIGALVVVDGPNVVGLLTQREFAIGLARFGAQLAKTKVQEIMRRTFVTVAANETTKQTMALMTLNRATHIPVMDQDRLAGLVSIGDIVKDRLDDLELETNVLRDAYIASR